jgi:hypothetical protein
MMGLWRRTPGAEQVRALVDGGGAQALVEVVVLLLLLLVGDCSGVGGGVQALMQGVKRAAVPLTNGGEAPHVLHQLECVQSPPAPACIVLLRPLSLRALYDGTTALRASVGR